MGQDNFTLDREIAKTNELMIANKYKELGLINDFAMAPDRYFPDYDVIFYKDGEEETVECKEDFTHAKTGNLFIEYGREYQDGTFQFSDLTATTAFKHIFSVHFIDKVQIYEITTYKLIELLRKNRMPNRSTIDKTQSFKSLGVLLRFERYQHHFKFIYEYTK